MSAAPRWLSSAPRNVRLLSSILLVGGGILGLCQLAQAQPLRQLLLLSPSAAGMVETGDRVFVEGAMSEGARTQLKHSIAEAKRRLQSYFPGKQLQPIIFACSTTACFHKLGGAGGRGLQWGERVLLAPGGLSPAIVAHEWVHVAVERKLGPLRRLPTWFHEGLAAHVSQDERYSAQAYERYETRTPDAAARLHAVAKALTKKEFFSHQDAYLLSAERTRRRLGARGKLALDQALLTGELPK